MPWTQTDLSFKKLSNKRITTSTGKGLPEEKGASTLELYLPDVKTGLIPGTPPGASTDVLYYTGAIGQTLVVDTSVPNNLTWFATTGYGNTTAANDGSALSESQRLGDWVSDKYDGFGTVSGAGYEIKVYDKDSNLITKSDSSNWLFDYQTGILVFNNNVTSYGTGVSAIGPFRIVGYRYVGPKGIIPASYGGTGYTNFTNGDLLVGAGGTFIKLPVGTDGYVLGADSTRPSGIGWTSVSAVTVSDTAPASPKSADLWYNSLDGGLLIYYADGSSSQWTEINLGSGIDLTQQINITNATSSTSVTSGALIINGGLGVGGDVYANSFNISTFNSMQAGIYTASSTTANQVAFSFSSSSYRSAKFWVQTSSSSSYQMDEIVALHNGTNAFITQFASVDTAGIATTFDADISGGNFRLLVTPTSNNTTYNINCLAIRA